MVRESTDNNLKDEYIMNFPELNPDFIFAYPSFNFRNTEIGAILGLSQLRRLNEIIKLRTKNR